MKNNLSLLSPGESGVVTGLSDSRLSTRLVDMGIYKGKTVKVLFRAPFGDPIAVDVGGYVLSLRLSEAKVVSLEPLSIKVGNGH